MVLLSALESGVHVWGYGIECNTYYTDFQQKSKGAGGVCTYICACGICLCVYLL